MALWYRLGVAVVVAVAFAVQHTVRKYLSGPNETLAGYLVTLVFFASVAELSTMFVWRRFTRESAATDPGGGRVPVVGVLAIASLLLILAVFTKELGPYLAVQRSPPPTFPLLILVGGWLAVIWGARRPRASYWACLLGLAGLVLGTRVLVLRVCSFDELNGDMLSTIDRALDKLLAGRFPNADFPPPMPYLPGTFLAYVPPKLLGVDLRLSNLVLDVVAVAVAMAFPPGTTGHPRGGGPPVRGPARFAPDQLALPLFMLHPTWIYYSVNTQFAPCLLATALLGRAITRAGPLLQAAALGLAVGSNQMLAAAGPILFGYWAGRHGVRRALGFSALAIGVFLAIIGPFLLWDPARFVRVCFLSRAAFPPEFMSGRLTLLPLFLGVVPHAGACLSALAVGIAALAAWRASRPQAAVAAVTLGLCAALLVQPVSFTHYFLPVLVLAGLAIDGRVAHPREGDASRVPIPIVTQARATAIRDRHALTTPAAQPDPRPGRPSIPPR